ncbi:MAG TPA: HAD-IA family hydrolase [Capillimicrobium sp.]|nr:HAD-IA family hydrolase [Capillimicrobium sp.]
MIAATAAAHPLLRDAAALLVDLDGTLVDSTAPVVRAWTAFAHRHGLDPEHVLRSAQGRPSRETAASFTPPELHAREAAAIEHAEVHDTDGVVALPGAAALLRSATPLAIVTSCSTALARARLRASGLPVPDVLVSCDDVARGKPDPEPFLLGARRLGVDVERCVVLEDAPAGIAAGRAAGARVIAVRTGHAAAELAAASPHAIVDDLRALGLDAR